jgi:hypothetical protein
MPFTSAILYRHWLEIRSGLAVAGIATALVSVIAFLVVSFSPGSGREAFALSAHAWSTAITALLAAVVVSGTGIRTSGFNPGDSSLQYTLALPVARSAWIVTRFATGLAGMIAPVAVIFLVDVAAFLVSGDAAPVGRMVRVSLTIGFVAAMTGAVFGVLLPIWRDWMQPLGGTVVFTSTVLFAANALNGYSLFPGWPTPIRALLERPPDVWAMAAATVLVVTGLLRLAVAIARRQDF